MGRTLLPVFILWLKLPALPGHRIGGEDGGRLVARIDHADAALLAADQDWRDMTAAEGEQKPGALSGKDTRDQIAAVHRLLLYRRL